MTGDDLVCNQTALFCKEFDAGTCEDIQFRFNGNWTTETLVTQVLSIHIQDSGYTRLKYFLVF